MSVDGESKAQFFKSIKFKFNKCLSPTMNCPDSAIKAHSVQKATALALIEEAGHVTELKMKIANDNPVCEFVKVGRNSASTFTGFCSHHDTKIFHSIDTKPLNLQDPEQLFLIAYRAVTRDLHVLMESGARLQAAHVWRVDSGVVGANEASPSAIAPMEQMYKSWQVWRYRNKYYDHVFADGDYKDILHSTFIIAGRQPVLAAASFFPIDNRFPKDSKARIALNVIPISQDETAVIFSYPKEQSGPSRRHIANVMLKKGDDQLLALSTLMLDTTENFFIRPSHVAGWSDEKRSFIEKAYLSTVTAGAFLRNAPELMLF